MFYNKGWKGSIKAKHLAIILRDHLVESRASSARKSDREPKTVTPVPAIKWETDIPSSSIPEDDTWTLWYLTVGRLQQLMEAFDDDNSSFVTISEANSFMDAHPPSWR